MNLSWTDVIHKSLYIFPENQKLHKVKTMKLLVYKLKVSIIYSLLDIFYS